jgi:hypothetical protein
MRFDPKIPSRPFAVGRDNGWTMNDCGTMTLEPNEQITITTPSGAEYDIARKEWGFYATPSLNGRLASFGLRAALVINRMTGRYFVMLVERGHESAFFTYLAHESCEVAAWMDSTESLDRLRTGEGSNRE